MWEDDRHWLPGLLDGRTFRASFHFDEQTAYGFYGYEFA
jgi:hypothetical protein